jgi:hypothetical protein
MKINPTKIVVDKIRYCYTKKLDGLIDWSVIVWRNKHLFASYTINSGMSFKFMKDAEADLNNTLKHLNLEAKSVSEKQEK